MYLSASNFNTVPGATFKKNENVGIYFNVACDNKFNNCTTEDNGGIGIGNVNSQNYFNYLTNNDSTQWSGTTAAYANLYTFSNNHDNTAGKFKIWTDGGVIDSDSGADRHTASGICWKMSVTDSDRDVLNPVKLSVGKVAVNASAAVTFSVWVKKSHATNITAKLVLPGGQLAGIANDVTDTKADDTDYEELSVVATPTDAGVLEYEVWGYYSGASANIWIDDVTVTQA